VLAAEAVMIGGLGSRERTDRLLAHARATGRSSDPVVRSGLARLLEREHVLGWMSALTRAAVRSGGRPPIDGSLLKIYWAETLVARGELAMQIGGPAALVRGDDGTPWQLELMSRYGGTIGGGTTEVHRNNLAERVLGLPGEPRADKDVAWRDLPR
jgi:alkylation response protein AidB-like acyl-CoA dehydrogenase